LITLHFRFPIPAPEGCVFNDADDPTPRTEFYLMGPEKKKISVREYRQKRRKALEKEVEREVRVSWSDG